MNGLSALGRYVAERQDELRERSGAAAVARRAIFERPIPRSRRWPFMLAAAALSTALVALLVFRPWTDIATTVVGSYQDPQVLHFGDGSQLTLKPGATLRVDVVDPHGATVTLERGSIFASVVSREHTRWSFRAGPYVVQVTGTAFDLDWSAPTLSIAMHEGSVLVSGPDLAEPQRVVAGEQAVFPKVVPKKKASRSAPTPSPTPTPTLEKQPSPEDWQTRAARGDYRGAYEQVAPRLDAELASLDAATLLRLATVARLSGHPDSSRRVYATLRARFPGTPSAAEAAFSLGTIAFDSNPAEAERWFQLALAEGPGFAAAARGRLLELAVRRGDAKAAAADYLRHHPDGPHAALARDVLAR